MQLLILAHALDSGAQSVASALAPRLNYHLSVLRPEWLGQANWSQRLDSEGRTHTQLCWRNGHRLDSSQIGLVWNRTRSLPKAASRLGSMGDRDHAGPELQGLVANWLSSLDDCVEPSIRRHASVTPQLQGLHWASAARRSGLEIAADAPAGEDFGVLRTPLGLCGAARSDWPASLVRACHGLADELGFALLSLGFKGTPEAPLLTRVEVHPALAAEGEVQAVARWLVHTFDSSLGPVSGSVAPVLNA